MTDRPSDVGDGAHEVPEIPAPREEGRGAEGYPRLAEGGGENSATPTETSPGGGESAATPGETAAATPETGAPTSTAAAGGGENAATPMPTEAGPEAAGMAGAQPGQGDESAGYATLADDTRNEANPEQAEAVTPESTESSGNPAECGYPELANEDDAEADTGTDADPNLGTQEPANDQAEPEHEPETEQKPPNEPPPPQPEPPTHPQTPEDLFAFGGRREDGFPRPPRERDFGVSSPADSVGPDGPPTAPTDEIPGASTFTSVDAGQAQGLSGQVFRLPEGTELPAGIDVHADGADVGGLAPEGHRTVYPSSGMPLSEFQDRYANSGWQWHGTVNKKGNFTPAQPDS